MDILRNTVIFTLFTLQGSLSKALAADARNFCQTTNENIILMDKPVVISYEGNEDINCNWKIPQSVRKQKYAVVLWMENVTLPETEQGCRGSLRFPGVQHSCKWKDNDCLIYTTREDGCSMDELRSVFSIDNFNCTEIKFWNSDTNQEFDYSGKKDGSYKKTFILHYEPIRCILPTMTLEPTTTSTSRINASPSLSTDATLSNQQSSLQSEHTRTTGILVGTAQTRFDLSRARNSSFPVAVVVVPITVVFLLVIGVLLYHRHSKRISSSKTRTNDKSHQTTQNEIYNNEDFHCEQAVTITNEVYDGNDFNQDDEDEQCFYTAVNKPKKNKDGGKPKQGKKFNPEDGDREPQDDVYTAVYKDRK